MPAQPPVASDQIPALGDVEAFLKDVVPRFTFDEAEARRSGRGRPRILPATCLWAALLVCIVRGASSQLEIWRLLRDTRLWDFPRYLVSDQAIYNRLARAGTAPLEGLFAAVSTLLAERLEPLLPSEPLAPFASAVMALDETTLDALARRLPSLRALPAGDTRLLAGKLAGLFDLRRQQWHTLVPIADAQQNEKVAARDLVATLPPGSLVLADLGYFGFRWFDDLTDAGHCWLSRLRQKTSYTLIHTYYQQGDTLDALVWLGIHRADRAKHAVRLVQFRHRGTLHRYITNVTDPQQLRLHELAELYARRWDIEMAVQLVKEHLGLHLWWSSKPGVVAQQLWGVLIVAQILQALRLEIAARAGVEPFDVSLPLLVRFLPQYLARGHDPIAAFVEQGRDLGFIRPSRRIRIQAPVLDLAAYHPPPSDLVREREPRYAGRRCGPPTN